MPDLRKEKFTIGISISPEEINDNSTNVEFLRGLKPHPQPFSLGEGSRLVIFEDIY